MYPKNSVRILLKIADFQILSILRGMHTNVKNILRNVLNNAQSWLTRAYKHAILIPRYETSSIYSFNSSIEINYET